MNNRIFLLVTFLYACISMQAQTITGQVMDEGQIPVG